ncbi:MAG: DHA2 family efflux MFS transporter permease subunit [Propionibacteriaceae bacterium]
MTAIPMPQSAEREDPSAWRALWALMIGFFILMIDGTVVSVAIPAIMKSFDAGVADIVWVSSSYLLTTAVPLMIMGRLGDRFGPRRIYLIGLIIFTVASLGCGLAPSIITLIAARAAQGFGASMMSPQTMAVTTRLFPPSRRGAPMGLWGATAGVASLLGPILGGILTDTVNWRWIFFINVPIGIIALILALRWVPRLETHAHQWDWPGVALNAAGLFCLVFALQEGQSHNWAPWIWLLVGSGIAILGAFVLWQKLNRGEPLMPLSLFTSSHNFSVATVGSFVMGLVSVAITFPVMLFLQTARGLTPTQAALLGIPSALISMIGAPLVGKWINIHDNKPVILLGFAVFGISLVMQFFLIIIPGTSVLWFLLANFLVGTAGCFLWGPLANSASRTLDVRMAGAGSGVYNATRQLGAVLGSAAIAAMMEWQLVHRLPTGGRSPIGEGATRTSGTRLPEFLQGPFSQAMAHSLWLPLAGILLGFIAAMMLRHRDQVL